jgi:hypothetical protein
MKVQNHPCIDRQKTLRGVFAPNVVAQFVLWTMAMSFFASHWQRSIAQKR